MFDELLSPLLTTDWGRRAGVGIAMVMGLLLGITVVVSVLAIHSDFKLAATPNTRIKVVDSSNDVFDKISEIPSWHLFGKFGMVAQTTILPITSLQLRLIGVSKAIQDKWSRVIISESGQTGKVYQIGDVLSSGVKVSGITADGVVLENGGRMEKLPLQRELLHFNGKPKSLLDTEGE